MINFKDEGYIKFKADHTFKTINIPDDIFKQLTAWRTRLFDLNLIGETSEGIGFGNISIKYENGFFITGSTTGSKRKLLKEGYAFVSGYDLGKNIVTSYGMSKASSESMSHAAIYECNDEIKAVIHIHNTYIWSKNLNKLPTTEKNITFGTPEMAYEIINLLNSPLNYNKGIVIMGGHPDGIISWGNNLDEAGQRILNINE